MVINKNKLRQLLFINFDVININGMRRIDKEAEILKDAHLLSKINAHEKIWGITDKKARTLHIYSTDGKIQMPKNAAMMFMGFRGKTISFQNVDFSRVEDASYMFANCDKLEGIEYSLSMEMPELENAGYMFYRCNSLQRITLTFYKSSKLKYISSMFSGCTALKEAYLYFNPEHCGIWSTHGMFSNCKQLEKCQLMDMNTMNVMDMQSMFQGCSKLKELITTRFDTRKVKYAIAMFKGCEKLEESALPELQLDSLKSSDYMLFGTAINEMDFIIDDKTDFDKVKNVFGIDNAEVLCYGGNIMRIVSKYPHSTHY